MIFRKLLKRQEPALAPAKSAKSPAAQSPKPTSAPPTTLSERRSFPRPLPVPEVHEQDWAAWEHVTKEKTVDKPV